VTPNALRVIVGIIILTHVILVLEGICNQKNLLPWLANFGIQGYIWWDFDEIWSIFGVYLSLNVTSQIFTIAGCLIVIHGTQGDA